MATTSDLAPNRTRKSAGAGAARARSREESLEGQVSKLQADLKSITATLARMGNDKVSEAREGAESEYRHLLRQGRAAVKEARSQAGALETQLVDTIREKPLTAMAGAIGIGFLLALLSRR